MLTCLILLSCATYQGYVDSARNKIQNGQWQEAIQLLEPLALKDSNDQLVYLLDYATTLQMASKYQDSNKYFIQADKLSDLKDYTSLSRETGAFILNEEMVQYKGEDYEIILINAMTAINYLMLNDLDSALVEVRRLNEKLNRFRMEAKRKFTDNAFALYLSGIIWEASRKWDDAYISYEAAYKLAPHYQQLKEDLLRISKKAKRMEQYKIWKDTFSDISEVNWMEDSKKGELIIIYEKGWVPRKNFRPDNFRYPKMFPVWSRTQGISVKVFNSKNESSFDDSSIRYRQEPLFSVEKMAIQSLEDQFASLVGRRIVGAITKNVLADQVRQKNEALGLLTNIVLHASDRADLRQWSTLPSGFQIVRIPLDEGEYNISIQGRDSGYTSTNESWNNPVKIISGKKVFQMIRSLH